MPRVEIRLLKTQKEFRACERIQMSVWGTLAAGSELLSVMQKHGGAVLGARVNGKIAGFVYAFLARYRGQLVHWSHMMAVEHGYRDRGLGLRMKLAHRRLALKQGIKSICWTYDPLQSRNATLNISRLRAQVEEYIPDCYGHFFSLIEKGLPSDRFVVNWRIARARIPRRLREQPSALSLSAPPINETRLGQRGFLQNQRIWLHRKEPRLLVEIPASTDEMRTSALPLARQWRAETRRIFTRYFATHYGVADFFPPTPASEGRCFYLLSRSRSRSARYR